jgi:hypothetical protein
MPTWRHRQDRALVDVETGIRIQLSEPTADLEVRLRPRGAARESHYYTEIWVLRPET